MHELSLIRTLLQQVDAIQASHADCVLRRIDVSVGEFSGIDPELLRLAFSSTSEGNSLAGVEFRVARVPLCARCRNCDREFPVHRFRFVCPNCECTGTDVVRGEELRLESVTFEEQEA